LERPSATVVKPVDRTLGAAHPFGDLARREADDMAQDNHLALVFGQRGKRHPHRLDVILIRSRA
jgi:hypothetical protein